MADPGTRDAEIFAEALRLPAAERAGHVTQACGPDAALRRRVEELLDAQGRLGDFLEAPNAESGFSVAAAISEGERERVGRYRLLEKIGEGGCGVVYRAEQDEPVRREVALKIIKPGMDTKEVIARFEAERQALAMMDHPGIAKVHDAGQTDSGRPYFVMELIRGTKITDYCDQQALPTEGRLQLFVQVCQAIQHAHQKGVIHRDIKPSNILVTENAEGVRQPVVIDFGIAKATVNVRLTDKTLFTAVDMLIGTPTYMSPEQATVAAADVDTRSDIYSLGVLLYELLTGTTPFDAGELLQLGIDEVRRAIREQEPLRPSARLSKMSGEQLTVVARSRQEEPPTLIRAVRGDLDWIAMKALEKDRSRRYATANGLAFDVARFLADEPVSARPASAAYRVRKMVARNKIWFGSAALAAVFLVGSLIVVSIALAKERHARRDADLARQQAEADKGRAEKRETSSRQITKFLQDLLLGVGPAVAKGRDTEVLREILETTSRRLTQELGDQPAIRAELELGIGRVYAEAHLWPQAIEHNRLAVAAFAQDPGPESKEVAKAVTELAYALMNSNQPVEAESAYRDALRIRRQQLAPNDPDIATSIHNLARFLWYFGPNKSEAEALFREALAMRRRLLPADHAEITSSLYMLGLILYRQDDRLAEAEAVQRDVLSRWIKASGPEGLNVDAGTLVLGRTLGLEAKLSEAEAMFRESLRIGRKVLGNSHPNTVNSLVGLGPVLSAQGRLAESEAVFREALSLRGKLEGTRLNAAILDILAGLLPLVVARGDLGEAETLAREGCKLAQAFVGGESQEAAAAAGRLAGVLLAVRKGDEADRLLDEFASPEFRAQPASGHFFRVRANYQARRGRWAAAIADARASIAHRPNDPEGYHVLSALHVQARNREEHRAVVQTLLQRFGQTGTAIVAARLAMDCLVLAPAEADLPALTGWVETGVQGGLEGNWKTYAECAKALLEYRRSHFSTAVAWAEKARQGVRPDIRAMACAVLAMAHVRVGDAAAARASLAAGHALRPGQSADAAGDDLGGEWKEWIHADLGSEWKGGILARALLAEAGEMIESAPTPASGLSSARP